MSPEEAVVCIEESAGNGLLSSLCIALGFDHYVSERGFVSCVRCIGHYIFLHDTSRSTNCLYYYIFRYSSAITRKMFATYI